MEEEERGRKGLFRGVGEVREKKDDERGLKKNDRKEKMQGETGTEGMWGWRRG